MNKLLKMAAFRALYLQLLAYIFRYYWTLKGATLSILKEFFTNVVIHSKAVVVGPISLETSLTQLSINLKSRLFITLFKIESYHLNERQDVFRIYQSSKKMRI